VQYSAGGETLVTAAFISRIKVSCLPVAAVAAVAGNGLVVGAPGQVQIRKGRGSSSSILRRQGREPRRPGLKH
jgi:hypothetical protein